MFFKHDPILTKDSIRCHSNFLRYSWSRLYYLCRLNDQAGKGIVIFSWNAVKNVLNCGNSTLWYWLKQGKLAGAFIFYRKEGDSLYIRLGSKMRIARTLNLDSWGETAYVNFEDLQSLSSARATGTEIATQKTQRSAYSAAIGSLDSEERKKYPVVETQKIFAQVEKASLCKTGLRAPNFLILHVSERYLFVSKGFIPYGTNQSAIARQLGVSDRTVRRQLARVERRQIAQAKGEYANLHKTLLSEGGGGINDSYTIEERAGHTSHFDSLEVCPARFFKCMGKTWLTRNNLYNLNYLLVKERFARRKYKRSLSKIENLRSDCSIRDLNVFESRSESGKIELTQ